MTKTFAWTVGAAATKISNDTGTGYEEPQEDGRPSLDGGQIITQVFEEQASEIKISSWQAGVVFFKSCFGVCTLGMPFAFRNSGIIPGVMCVILVAFITNFATKLLVWNKRHLQETRCKGIVSIPDMALTLWGAPGLAFTNTVILICQIGNCIAYFIFLSISLTAVIEDFFPSLEAEHSYSPYIVLIICWSVIFSILVQLKNVAALTPFLILAQAAMVTAVVLIIGYGLTHPSVCDKDGTVKIFCKVHTGARWETFPVFLGIAIFAIEGIPTVLAIENSMAEPHRFEEVFDRSQGLLTIVFLLFGTFGYWLYGHNTKSVITLNIQGMWGIVVKCLLCLVIALSFPLQFMPAGQVLRMFSEHPLFLRLAGRALDSRPVRQRWPALAALTDEQISAYGWAGLKVFAVGCAGGVAIAFPHFGHVLSLLGSVTFAMITFIVPPGLYLTSMQGEHRAQMVALCLATMAFGAAVMVVGLWSNFVSLQALGNTMEEAPPTPQSAAVQQAQSIFRGAAAMKGIAAAAAAAAAAPRPPPLPAFAPVAAARPFPPPAAALAAGRNPPPHH